MISPTNEDVPTGLKLHIADIYMDELEKVGIGEVCAAYFYISYITSGCLYGIFKVFYVKELWHAYILCYNYALN